MHTLKFMMAALIAIPIGALAQNDSPTTPGQSTLQEGQTSTSCISNFTFSQDFLGKYPNAGGACREVKMEGGKKWARFDGDVVNVFADRISVNIVNRYDKSAGTITFAAPPNDPVTVNGSSKKFRDLQKGDKLTFWMPEDRVGFYAGPDTATSTKLAVVTALTAD
jgi:hypothetical protein